MDMGELKDLFEQLDTDKTGSVTFDEFMVALRVSITLGSKAGPHHFSIGLKFRTNDKSHKFQLLAYETFFRP